MPRAFTSQLARPRGVIGRGVRREMAVVNAAMIQQAIEILSVQSGDRVLEIGFGNPDSLARLVELASPGPVVGVDHSPLVVQATCRRLKSYLSARRLRVIEGAASALPLEDGSVDKILAVNTVTYWPDLDEGFKQLSRVASSHAALVVGVRSPRLLKRLGIAGDSVHYLAPEDLTKLGERHGWLAEETVVDSDRLGEFIVVPLRASG